jgi:microcystin-dependent protein
VTIASAGYSGTVTQENWATMAQFAGVDTAVATATDCAVTGAAGTRVVSVSPGVAWGWGVLDTLSGSNTVSLAANGTGATRWDAIVVRRNWSTGTTTLAAVTGGSAETAPTLTVTPGVQADQMLALVAVPAGATNLEGATVRPWVQWPVQTTYGPRAPYGPSYGQRWVDSATGTTYAWDGSAWGDTTGAAVGTIVMWGGSETPTGWHLCDGSLHGSAALAAVIGSTRTPDLRDRFVVGAGGTYQKGITGGVAAVTLTEGQSGLRTHGHGASSAGEAQEHTHSGGTGGVSVDHSHYVSLGGGGHGHNSSYGNNYQLSGQDQNLAGDVAGPIANSADRIGSLFTDGGHGHAGQSGGISSDHSHSFTTGGRSAQHSHAVTVSGVAGASASEPHENRPPFYALTFIMRKA